MEKITKMFPSKSSRNGTYSVGLAVIVIAIAIVINLVAGQLPENLRNIDISNNNLYEISDVSEEETALRKVMLSRSKKKIFLCDSSKLGQKKTFTLCSKDDIDVIICNKSLPWEQ